MFGCPRWSAGWPWPGVWSRLDDLAGVTVVGGDEDRRVRSFLAKARAALTAASSRRSHRSGRRRRRRGPACRSRRPRPAGRSPCRCRVVQQLDRLAGHVGQLRLGGRPGRVRGAARSARCRRGGPRAGPVHRHVALANRPSTGLLRAPPPGRPRCRPRVAGRLGLLQHGHAGELAGRGGLGEVRRAAAEQDVGAGLDELLGDRAERRRSPWRWRARRSSRPGPCSRG